MRKVGKGERYYRHRISFLKSNSRTRSAASILSPLFTPAAIQPSGSGLTEDIPHHQNGHSFAYRALAAFHPRFRAHLTFENDN